jgi:D-glycero-D-manno-heptose 1,7-bisphosphate phosphatase
VLNKMVVDPEQGTIDSPLHPNQVAMVPGAPKALALLTRAGYVLAIVSNQPAWAKGKTTKKNLLQVHEHIVSKLQSTGGRISSNHLCFHKSEDHCACRKPKTGLLQDAIRQNGPFKKHDIWMVGDGIIDVQAGQALGVQTVFVAKKKNDALQILREHHLRPTRWAEDITQFAADLLQP